MKLEKITKTPDARQRRRYEDACAAAHGMDLLGERWALLVVRELMWGPRRFSDLRSALPGISANVLTQRLEGLEAAGVLVRRRLPPPAASQVYELTEWGYESEPIFQALGRWAVRSPAHDPSMPLSAASLMLSLRAMFAAERVGGFAARIGLVVDGQAFLAEVANGRIAIAARAPDEADVVLAAEAPVIGGAIYGGVPLAALEADGVLEITGDRAVAQRFVTLYSLPPKVGTGPASALPERRDPVRHDDLPLTSTAGRNT
ncbi:winged helix-turn-helix transcriptional regulator [Aurantimonas sp. A2-1-M11]|uniref:winged helix-turn-helix transcriptional regulator n=1 Tax=Aurantimonas sp. A2-1-M11 TaxID=3113712 RepID=UPI002F956056